MAEKVPSPLTDEPDETTDDEIFEIVYFRVVSTDEDWEEDPASDLYDLTREEAATRLAEEDYSPLR